VGVSVVSLEKCLLFIFIWKLIVRLPRIMRNYQVLSFADQYIPNVLQICDAVYF